MAKCVVARHINGITLNGYEYALDGDGNVRVFDSKQQAIDALVDAGATSEDIYHFMFFSANKLKQGIFEEV